MRYALTDTEWKFIQPILPCKPREVKRVDDRRVLNGIFWILRPGTSWRDLPDCFGPCTTCHNRFIRWQRAGVWDNILEAISNQQDPDVQMIDSSIIRVHQHAACIKHNETNCTGRSRSGQITKIHAVVDSNGLPLRLVLTRGQQHDSLIATELMIGLRKKDMLLADKVYVSDAIRTFASERGAWPIFHPSVIEKTPSASVHFFTESAIMLSVSSTGSSNVAVLPPGIRY
jgi:transposase